MEGDYNVSVKALEGRHIDQHYYHHHRQDLIETEVNATNKIADDGDDDENNHSNNNAIEDSHDGDDLIEMTENNMKSESDENGPNMHVGTPSKLRLDSKDPLRPRRKKARRACYACQRAHLTCGMYVSFELSICVFFVHSKKIINFVDDSLIFPKKRGAILHVLEVGLRSQRVSKKKKKQERRKRLINLK